MHVHWWKRQNQEKWPRLSPQSRPIRPTIWVKSLAQFDLIRCTSWGRTFLDGLDRSRLIAFAADWPESESASGFTNFCRSMTCSDEPLALDMFESFIPIAQKLLSRDTVSAFGDLFHIAHQVLRVLDVLGIFVGKAAPKSRHRELAREMMQGVSPSLLADQLSASQLRQFQNTGFLLTFMANAVPAKFRATVATMDWARIAETIGDHWRDLPHEPEVLFGIAYCARSCREKIAQVINDNLHRIEAFPPRLVLSRTKCRIYACGARWSYPTSEI